MVRHSFSNINIHLVSPWNHKLVRFRIEVSMSCAQIQLPLSNQRDFFSHLHAIYSQLGNHFHAIIRTLCAYSPTKLLCCDSILVCQNIPKSDSTSLSHSEWKLRYIHRNCKRVVEITLHENLLPYISFASTNLTFALEFIDLNF